VGISLIALLLILFLTRNIFKNHIQYLTFIALLFYNISRLVLMKINFSTATTTGQFFQGYMFATVQWIVVNKMGRMDHIICTIFLSLGLRFGIIYGAIQPEVVDPASVLRQVLIDSFMIFVCYSNEKNERRVFCNFYENREELSKFKELLDDSLPQSVIILDCKDQSPLFSNSAFSKTFARKQENEAMDLALTELINENAENAKPYLASLRIDTTTLREVGSAQNDFSSIAFSQSMPYGKEFLSKLIEGDILHDKVLFVSAYCSVGEQRKSFELALKKVKWNRLDSVAIILNEITYQEKLIALKAANLNKDKILATVSHELRTPLHAIIGILKMNEHQIKDPEVLENLSLCKDNAYLLLSLVNSILDLHQIRSGKLKLNLDKFEIRKFFADVLRLFSFQCGQNGIYLEINIDQSVPKCIVTDGNRLRQILINLVGNAIKFTSKGGIKVEVIQDLQDEERLQISVTDTGAGIKEQDIPKLFKMEGKLEDTQSVNKHGVGLGLTISNALAVLLNGNDAKDGTGIVVKSQHHAGSTFSFHILKKLSELSSSMTNKGRNASTTLGDNRYLLENNDDSLPNVSSEEIVTPMNLELKLASYTSSFKRDSNSKNSKPPLEKSLSIQIHQNYPSKFYGGQVSQPIASTNPDQENVFSKFWILVVDDNPFNLLVASNLVKDVGYSVKLAKGGKEAIELAKAMKEQNENLKVIFMDCQMPIMDGYETTIVLLELMQKNQVQNTPVFGWTAHNSKEDVQRCFDCGMKGHVAKPTSQEELIKVLSEIS